MTTGARRAGRAGVTLVLLLAATTFAAWRQSVADAPEAPPIAEPVFDARSGLHAGWKDYGWAPRRVRAGAPVALDLSAAGGWIVAHPGALPGRFGGLRFDVRAPEASPELLEVSLDASLPRAPFPRVALRAASHRVSEKDGVWSVFLAMQELNPQAVEFDRIVFRARQAVAGQVELDAIGLTTVTAAAATAASAAPTQRPARVARFTLDCEAQAHPIDPMIYGIAYDPRRAARDTHVWRLGASARRWGGNPASRYNWELGNAWNTGSDWFFQNVNATGQPGDAWLRFMNENVERGVVGALTVPMLGWVAKDTRAYAFPVAQFGAQQRTAPENPDAGNGVGPDGKPIPPGPPTQTSVPLPPESVTRWVRAIRERERDGRARVQLYILDNEPMLWASTHRDVHPEPTTYDELLERTLAYSAAVRAAHPQALIAGPALWGWPAYFYSAADQVSGFAARPDRRAHGDLPFLAWWLRELRAHERRTGQRPVDVVDVHFYPQAPGVGGLHGLTDDGAAALRLRSTRGLWDPAYLDESWIGERIQLVPRLRAWIAEHAPGLELAIGEWNFGAETHMSGGLATAEALGRFGLLGLRAAFYWDYPPDQSPAFWAFRAFRDFDGQGARFLDLSVPVSGSDGPRGTSGASLFASRDDAGTRLVAVLLNFDQRQALEARVDLGRCGALDARPRVFTYAGDAEGLRATSLAAHDARGLAYSAPPWSMSVFELPLARAADVRRAATP